MLQVIHCSEGLVIQGVVLNVYPKRGGKKTCSLEITGNLVLNKPIDISTEADAKTIFGDSESPSRRGKAGVLPPLSDYHHEGSNLFLPPVNNNARVDDFQIKISAVVSFSKSYLLSLPFGSYDASKVVIDNENLSSTSAGCYTDGVVVYGDKSKQKTIVSLFNIVGLKEDKPRCMQADTEPSILIQSPPKSGSKHKGRRPKRPDNKTQWW